MRAGTQAEDKHLCVVVKVADNDAFVLTAYLTTRPSGGRLDESGNVIGFSVMRVSALRDTPLEVAL